MRRLCLSPRFPGSGATLAHGCVDVYLFTVHLMLLSRISHSIPPSSVASALQEPPQVIGPRFTHLAKRLNQTNELPN